MNKNEYKNEHILVCLSSSPSNPKVIRTGAQMSKNYNAKFSALYIETSKILSEEDKERLAANSLLAKELGAKIVTLSGDDIPYQVSGYAKMAQVTKIIIGRSGYKPNRIFSPPGFIDKLISLTPEIEVFIIPDKTQKLYIPNRRAEYKEYSPITAMDIIKTIGILLLATFIAALFHMLNIYDANIVLVYIWGILLTAYVTENKIYSLVFSFFAVVLYNFFFIEPYFSLICDNKDYILTFTIMFIVAFMASSNTKKVRSQARQASLKAYRTETLLDLSQQLQQCVNEDEINRATQNQLKRLLQCDVCLYKEDFDNTEDAVLRWVFENNKEAGGGTKKYKDNKCFYTPISNSEKIFSVAVINKQSITEFERNLVSAMIREAVMAHEKNAANIIKNALVIKNKQEELRSTLLRAISHDLRTPLTGISGYAELLMKNSAQLSEEKKTNIYTDIYDDSIWLLNLVENLLSITRFDKESITIKQELEFVPDIINEAIAHLGRKKENYNVKTIFDNDDELYAKMDGRLIAQVVFNLVDNAMKYSPEHSTITIRAAVEGEYIEISVADEGRGISDSDKIKIFDLFYTVNSSAADSRRGLGLGLALCKAVIKAHGSEIYLRDNIPTGTIFSFRLKGEMYE